MDLEVFMDAGAFAGRVFPYLQEQEAEHNLLLGLIGRAARQATDSDVAYMALSRTGDRVTAVTFRTRGRPVVLSLGWDAEGLRRLADDIHERQRDLPGVLAPNDAGSAFAALWGSLTGVRAEARLRERIYQLDDVRDVRRPEGTMEPASAADRDLLVEWATAFTLETRDRPDPAFVQQMVDMRTPPTKAGGLYLWRVAGRPVAMAGYSGPTPNGIRVAPVYTPVADRRHGYATVLVADMSRLLLASGHRMCFLFTDLANPTSNDIYQQIGYRPVADMTEYHFVTDGHDGMRDA